MFGFFFEKLPSRNHRRYIIYICKKTNCLNVIEMYVLMVALPTLIWWENVFSRFFCHQKTLNEGRRRSKIINQIRQVTTSSISICICVYVYVFVFSFSFFFFFSFFLYHLSIRVQPQDGEYSPSFFFSFRLIIWTIQRAADSSLSFFPVPLQNVEATLVLLLLFFPLSRRLNKKKRNDQIDHCLFHIVGTYVIV
jgi:hypothetical protein